MIPYATYTVYIKKSNKLLTSNWGRDRDGGLISFDFTNDLILSDRITSGLFPSEVTLSNGLGEGRARDYFDLVEKDA